MNTGENPLKTVERGEKVRGFREKLAEESKERRARHGKCERLWGGGRKG